MNATTSGVLLVRVEVQSYGLRLTVITDRHDGYPPVTYECRDIDGAVCAVRDFLVTYLPRAFGPDAH